MDHVLTRLYLYFFLFFFFVAIYADSMPPLG
jgi:hypothetical protein